MISMSPSAHGERSLESVKDLVSLLRLRAAVQSDETAYIFLEDGETERARLTFWELDLRAKSIAAELQHMGLEDQIALLLYPPGIDYIEAFFGCLYAGVVAVPAYPPSGRHLQRLRAIVSDAKPAVIMTISSLHERFVAEEKEEAGIGRQRWCLTDGIDSDGVNWRPVAAEPGRLAFLQYTSGSTGDPRGVMVSHGNLIANQALIKESFGHSERSTLVGWLPLYHDMGLIGNILQPLYVGAKAVLMSPMAFLEKPIRWLRAISDYRAHTSGGPNFGFEHCVRRITESEKSGLDLRSWRIAFSGAEPVRAATLDRFAAAFAESGFRRDRFVPCYGLAEATLVVTAPTLGRAGALRQIDRRDVERNRATTVDSGEEAVSVIGCGRAWPGHEVVVVDPDTATRRADNEVGEIWVAGASVAQGYWNRPEKTATTFGARLADDPTQRFMRTGDLGFLDAGELFVTGRAKDIVIIAGRNYYPQDFECVIDDEVAEARAGCSAAFSIVVNEQEALVLLVEPQRSQLPSLRLGGAEALFHKIRECLARTSDIAPLEIVLVQPGSVPKTSSGKIRRSACRRSYLDNAFQVVAREGTQDDEARGEQTTATDDAGATALLRDTLPLLTPPHKAALISRFMTSTAARLLRIPASDLVADWPIIRVGLDSLRSVELKHALDEMLGTDVPLSLLMSEKTFTQIANELGAEERLGSSETTAVAEEDAGALSHTERAIWAVHQLEPSGVAYNLHLALGFEGRIDYRALEKALGDVFERHSILSSAYAVDGEGVVRSAQPNPGWFASVDATGWTSESLQNDMGRRAATPFDLSTGEVFRASLYRRGEERATLLLCAHHIALDLWSLLILLSELQKTYVARCSGRKAALRRPVADYVEFVSWQRRYLRSDSCERAWTYWRERLGGDLPVLALPIDHPRPSEPSYVGSSVRIDVGGQLATALRKFARDKGVTLFSLLLSAYKIVLYRHTHRSDIVVGTAGSGRSRERFRGVVGNFVNPLALRTRIEPSMRFSEYLRDVQGRVLEALEHQDFPFSELVERLEPERVVGQWPIFQTWFALQQAQSDAEGDFAEFALGEETASTPWGDGAIRGEAVTTRVERFDLKLMAAATRRGLVLSFQYRRDLFERTTIERFAELFRRVLEAIVADPEQRISALACSVVAEDDHEFSLAIGRTAQRETTSVHRLAWSWAAKTPDAVAVVANGERLTYADLEETSGRLAHRLRAGGVERGCAVGVCATRSVDTIVAILATLKAGAAYVPIDPDTPPTRAAGILENAGARWLLCRRDWFESSAIEFGAPIFLDRPGAAQDSAPRPFLDSEVGPQDAAYVIFTSGSSGVPKGVVVSHGSLVNYTSAILDRLGGEFGLHFALVSTLAADLGHTVVFSSLASGGCLHLLDHEQATDPHAFELYLRSNPIDVLKIVPSHYGALSPRSGEDAPLPRKALIFGGEALPTRLVKKLMSTETSCRFFNHYGPTETTVGALMLPLTDDAMNSFVGSAPLGGPIDNVRAYVLGPDLMPTPRGVRGEICLGGAGVARGYIGRPDLTAERFVPDPFGGPGERLYRTGDLGRMDNDGVLMFHGRIDQQIKIRGYRVEPGEIEARLRDHPDVDGAAVIAYETATGQARLAAYVVANGRPAPSSEVLRAHLGRSLPDYMSPSTFVSLDSFPVTSNGKIDRKRLTVPDGAATISAAYHAPRSDVEAQLARIYADVLGVDKVGVDDNFFSLGGDSITSIRAASRAYAAGLALSPSQIFRHQTIAELAAALTTRVAPVDGGRDCAANADSECVPLSPHAPREVSQPLAEASDIEDAYPLTPLQEGLLFHTLSQPGSGVYVMQHRYWIDGEVDVDLFRCAWQAIVDSHPIFRTSFAWEGLSKARQLVHRRANLPFDYYDWREVDEAEQESRLTALLAAERTDGFDLRRAPLAHIRLFRLESRRWLLIRSHHHILFDAWCTSLILRELQTNYEALSAGGTPRQRERRGFRDYIDWLGRQRPDAAERFWRDYLRGFDEPTPLFARRDNADGASERGIEDFVVRLSEEETANLEALAKRFRVTPNTFAQAALALLLAHYANRSDVVFGVTVSGRPADLPQVESILGLFINGLPLRLRVEPDLSLESFLRTVLEHNYAIRDYEYVSLTDIQEWSDVPRGTELFQYLLTFENAPIDPELLRANGSWRFTDCWHRTHTNYPVTFVVIPGTRLHLQVTYAPDRIDGATAQRLLSHYRGLLQQMVEHPGAKLGEFVVVQGEERRILVEDWNRTIHHYAEPRDIIGRFDEQVRRRPDAVAARCDGVEATYRELDRRSERVASGLIADGVQPDDIVALFDERGLDFLTMMLGVFKAGGGYLPLDPAYPDGRLAQILAEAKVEWLLAGSDHQDRAASILSGLSGKTPRLSNLASLEARTVERGTIARRHVPSNLAFVIYTSGSTGKPKGAVVEHRGMFNNLITKEGALALTTRDVIAQTASQCFDISVWQFLTALAIGSRVEIFRDEVSRDPQRLAAEIDARGVTVLEAVPSMIRALLDASETEGGLAALRWLLPCGEAFAPELCRRFMERYPHVRLLNAYGPAECSDDVSYHPIEAPPQGNELSMPIGRPVDNTQLYILDRWLEPAPVGVAGEICVSGVQVGRGYLHRPDLTAAAFLPDPFGPAGGRLYRTGDLGRFRADGVMEFLGRVDHQVKIRGNRIEPGEIEACLLTHPDVQDVCVVARETSKGVHRLVAYVVGSESGAGALREHLLKLLPEFMAPAAFIFLDALPLTPNGKVDRKRLPDVDAAQWPTRGYAPPRNPTEKVLCGIWEEVLRVEGVGVDDNFFELGGHSLLAIQVRSRIRTAFDVELPLRALFEATTIAAIAERIEDELIASLEAISDAEASNLREQIAG